MKRIISLLSLSCLLLVPINFSFAQGQLTGFEQEQPVVLAERALYQNSNGKEEALEISVDVSDLIEQGHEYWADMKFSKAKEMFEQAHRLRPDDPQIVGLVQKVELAALKYERMQAQQAAELAQEKRLLQTDQAWLRDSKTTTETIETEKSGQKESDILARKVSIDFSEAQLKNVIEYLSQLTGVNIVMDEAPVSRAGSISIHLNNVTLKRALESILRAKGLAYRLEDDFIWVSTEDSLANESMETRSYNLSHGLATFTRFTTFDTVTVDNLRSDNVVVMAKDSEAGGLGNSTETYEGVKIGGPGGVAGQLTYNISDAMRELVDWPEGSRIFLDNRTSTLIARNTPSNLAQVENLLKVLDVTPPQVMIEARFMEVAEDDLYSLGVEIAAIASGKGAAAPTTFPFKKSLSSDYLGSIPSLSTGDFTFGTLDFSQFQTLLAAIEQKTNTNTLSSPQVTTISGQEAIIKIVREIRYPTKFELEVFTTSINDQTYTQTSPVPAEFKTRDVGIILKVTPNVGEDRKTINLTLIPEVSEFDIEEDMFNYGTADSPYLQPFFDIRSATASIVVGDNDTVVMGGLMREVLDKGTARVPILGSIPVLGKLFSRDYESKEKRNLLIFVTARIVPPAGGQAQ